MASARGGAVGLALAAAADSLLALAFTVVFARVLGPSGYASLAVLVSTLLILAIAGSALQVTVAREIGAPTAGELDLAAAARRWTRVLAAVTVALLLISIALREPLAAALDVDAAWAAALVLPAAALELLLAVQRGILLGLGAYRVVGLSVAAVPAGWLLCGGALVLAGLGVTGALAGIAVAELAVAVAAVSAVRRRLPGGGVRDAAAAAPLPLLLPLPLLIRRSWAPMLSLALLAVLQNVDVIVFKHLAPSEAVASSYAAASVAAKVILWIAIGLGLYVLPETARRFGAGTDTRPPLVQGVALLAVAAAPMLLVYALAGRPLLAAVFGSELTLAAGALPLLALAMTFLATAYLAVQHLLARTRARFLWLLAAAAVLEPAALAAAAPRPADVALALATLDLAVAAALLAAAFRTAARAEPAPRPAG